MIMFYKFRPHRAIFRQHIIKESTALRTLSIVLLKYVVVVIVTDMVFAMQRLSNTRYITKRDVSIC
jgi:hypothetical protein